MKKIFKKTLPLFMAAMLVLPAAFSPIVAMAAEEDPAAGGDEFTQSWNVGKNDPTEVVATYSNGVLTFENKYVYDSTSGASRLPNPGLMKDNACGEIMSFFTDNEIKDVTVVIGDGVKTMGANSLSGCSAIKALSITSSDFEGIKEGALANCTNLGDVDLGGSVTEIGANVFSGDADLSSIYIPDSVTTIGAEAFANTGIQTIEGGSGVRSLGTKAFSGASKISLSEDASDTLVNYDWSGAGYTDINIAGAKQAVITFVMNGGTAIAPVTVNVGDKYTAPTPTYSGMTFDGWFTDSGFTKSFVADTVIENNITLYAKWHGEYVTVTFETNDGVAAKTQQVPYGGKATKPTDPTPSGDKVFSGWFSDKGCTKAFSFDTALTQDTTVYAKWGDATFYTVKFNTDGGSTVEDQSVKSGALVTRPADPTKDEYTFDGWYKSTKWKDKWDFDKNKVTADTTIYARFLSNKVTVKFDTRGGSTISSVTIDRGGKLTNPGNPTKDHAEFLGWYTDEECTKEFLIESESVKDNMTLYAKWNQTAFTVKFESNGGSSVESITANPNSLIAKPADPTKAGYYLVGWCKDSNLQNQWNFDSDKVTADVTLYALWAPGDPATVNNTAAPGVTNTGAKAPQTGDTSNPLFHLFAGLTAALSAIGPGVAVYAKRKTKLF